MMWWKCGHLKTASYEAPPCPLAISLCKISSTYGAIPWFTKIFGLQLYLLCKLTTWKQSFEEFNSIFQGAATSPIIHMLYCPHIFSLLTKLVLKTDIEWFRVGYIRWRPTAAVIELTGVVIITGSKVSLGSLAMFLDFFGLKKCLTFSRSSEFFPCFFPAVW